MAVEEKREGKLLSIQVARGIAALMVVLVHSASEVSLPQYVGYIPLGNFFSFGQSGVDFFFVLSGFIIYFMHSRDIGRPECARRYLWRRLTRIYPIYWIVMILVLGLSVVGHHFPEMGYLVRSLLLVPENQEPVLGVAWTLRHEMTFYLMFLTLILDRRAGILLFGLWGGLIGLGMFGVSLPSFGLQFLASPYHLEFFLGMAVAHTILTREVPIPTVLAIAGTIAFFTTCLIWSVGIVPREGYLLRVLYGVSAAVTMAGLAGAELKGKIVVGKFLSFLGEASYSIYLLHVVVIGLTARVIMNMGIVKTVPGWSVMTVAGVTSVVASLVLYQFIERPLLAWLQKFGRMHVYTSVARVPAAT